MDFYRNQKGSALIYSMVGLSILIGTSIVMMQQSRDHKYEESELSKTQNERLFKKKLATILKDTDVCTKNFSGASLGVPRNKILDSQGNLLYQLNKLYYGSTLKIESILPRSHVSLTNPPTTPTPETHFTLEISIAKTRSKNIEAQTQVLRFNVEASYVDPAHTIINKCKLVPSSSEDINQAIAHLCQGPGVTELADGNCKFLDLKPQTVSCPAGEAISNISFGTDPAKPNQLVVNCAPVITLPAMNCSFGVKYTGNAGKYECLTVTDVVNSNTQEVSIGSSCFVDVIGGQYVFKCGPP